MTKTSDTLRVLGNKHFLGLWVSQVFSQISIHIVNFALITRIFEQTGSSAAVSFLVFWFATPAVLLGILAGAYVDRWDRKKILISINIIQALLVLAYLLVGANYLLIYPIVFFYAACNQFFLPAEGAMIPTIIEERLRVTANSFYLFTTYASFIIGYGLSGPIMLLWGREFPFYLASFMLFGATLAVLAVPSDKSRAKTFRAKNAKNKLLDSVKKGLSFIKSKKRITYSISHLVLVQVILSALIALGPSFATEKLGTTIESASFMLVAPAGVGVALGSFILNRMKVKKNILRFVRNGVIAGSIMLFIVSILPFFGPDLKKAMIDFTHLSFLNKGTLLMATSFLITIFGLSAAFIVVPSQTVLQNDTESDMRGRVFGLTGMLVHVASLIPLIFFGVLADVFSSAVVLALISLLILVWSIFSHNGVRSYEK